MPGAHSLASTGLLQRRNGVNNIAAPQRQTFYLTDREKENIRVLHSLSRPGFLVMQSEQSLQRNDPLSNVPSQVNWERRSSYTSSASSKSSAGRPDHFVDSQLTDDFQDSLTHLPFNHLEDHFENDDIEDATAEDEVLLTAADNVTNQQVLQQPTQETIMDDLTLPPEWSGCPPDVVMNCCRAMSAEVKASGMKEFYKSYSSWDKMTHDQKN